MRPTVALIDTRVAAGALRTMLAALDVDTIVYPDAEAYLAQPTASPSCIVVALELAGMSGIELLRRLRAGGKRVPIVVVANDAPIATAVEAMRLGATDFIEKAQVDVALPRRVSQLLCANA